jgi:hypothetical protein
MQLKPLMTLVGKLRRPADLVGDVPLGQRMIAEVTGGSFEGDRLKGTIVTPGADWVLVSAGGIGHVDVRLTLKTDDDAFIYMQYLGKLVFNDKVAEAVQQGRGTEFGDTYFMTQPRFETGSQDYAWLNSIVAVAEGHLIEGGVEYRIYECQHD